MTINAMSLILRLTLGIMVLDSYSLLASFGVDDVLSRFINGKYMIGRSVENEENRKIRKERY